MNTRGNCLQLLLLFPVVLMMDWKAKVSKSTTWIRVPYILRIGNSINILGIVHENAEYCQMDFEYRKDSATALTSLHMKPRFWAKQTNVGVYYRGLWLNKGQPDAYFRFARGEPFDVVVELKQTGFRVLVDGYHYFNYKYFLNITSIRWVELKGDCDYFGTYFYG